MKTAGKKGAGQSRRRAALGPRECRRLIQLAVCAGIFLAVMTGRGVTPDTFAALSGQALEVIGSSTDFSAAFSRMGAALTGEEQLLQAVGGAVQQVFGAAEQTVTKGEESLPEPWAARQVMNVPEGYLFLGPGRQVAVPTVPAQQPEQTVQVQPAGDEPVSEQPAVQVPVYTGQSLPEGATMEYVSLDLPQTVTPVMGVLTSAYGYREHPLNGEHLFHSGVDVAADYGTPVVAFAAGVVEFIGESEAYGLYLQLDHGGGVKSFYCHCSRLLCGKGTNVEAGQAVAQVGDTGNVTGAHLHFELERDGVQLNPAYYIEVS